MTFRDAMILGFTLVVGILSGMYLYVTAYAPNYVDDDEELAFEEELSGDVSIIGILKGGFDRAQNVEPSFRINADGSYNYYPDDTEKVEGELPEELYQQFLRDLKEADLEAYAEPALEDKVCDPNEIEYEYNIEVGETEYVLDTCRTDFDRDSDLAHTLGQTWDYMEAPNSFSFSVRNLPSDETESGTPWWDLRGHLENAFISSGFDSTFDD